jgi:hypothetical protein
MLVTNDDIGALKTLTTTPYVFEQNLTPTAPPTAISTGSPQVSYTFNKSTTVPLFGGTARVKGYTSCFGFTLSGGKNTSGATVTLNYQINKNGSSWKTGNANIANNNYYTVAAYDFPNDGDVYDVYIWCTTASGMQYSYTANYCIAHQVDTGSKYMENYIFTASSITPLFSLTSMATSGSGNIYIYPIPNLSAVSNAILYGAGTTTIPLFTSNQTNKLFGFQNTTGTAVCNVSSTSLCTINSNLYIPSLSYRDIRL